MTQDQLFNGLLFQDQVRFVAINATELVNTAHQVHDTTATAIAALGRTLMGSILLAAMEKDDEVRYTVRIQGDGDLGTIVCVARGDATVKGYLVNPHIELPQKSNGKLDVGGAVGSNGTITVVRDSKTGQAYTGQASLVSGEIAEDFSAYLAFSQQQPSIVYLGVHVAKDFSIAAASGLIIQPLPGCPEEVISTLESMAFEIGRFTQSVQDKGSLEEALQELFATSDMKILSEITPKYACDCSRERLEQTLISLGRTELEDMIQSEENTEVVCYFCNTAYSFSKEELKQLLSEATGV